MNRITSKKGFLVRFFFIFFFFFLDEELGMSINWD